MGTWSLPYSKEVSMYVDLAGGKVDGNLSLVHYTGSPLGDVRLGIQVIEMKPKGLWVSVGCAWKEWCDEEGFRVDSTRRAYDIRLHPESEVLLLSDYDAMDEFNALHSMDRIGLCVDWPRLARMYDGIIISPYMWGRRLAGGFSWYYGWDVASGCIWNPDAISSTERREA
jgi:hypothetical protein